MKRTDSGATLGDGDEVLLYHGGRIRVQGGTIEPHIGGPPAIGDVPPGADAAALREAVNRLIAALRGVGILAQ